MKRLPALLLLAALAVLVRAGEPERTRVTLLATTDLHGNLLPVDYFTGQPAARGLAAVATLVRQVRREVPDALLLDCGDTIQGTPLAYVHARRNNAPPDPMMLALNELGCVSLTPGNHEFNFGAAVREKARAEARFPWISANILRAGTDETFYAPYVVREVRGVRVAILGLTTPAVPNWENPEHITGLEFRPLVATARRWVPVLREKERADVVVVAVHGGLEFDPATGRLPPGDFPGENAALALAREVPGIDVMFLGHTHRDVPALVVGSTVLSQAGRWGDRLARVDVTLARGADGRWAVETKAARTIPVQADTPADPAVAALAEPYHRETEAWLSRPIGTAARALDAADAAFADNALLDLVHRVQLEAGKADVSLAASFNPRLRIAAGPVTVRDIAALYVYENTLGVVEVTGAQLKAALEHSARYFGPHQEGRTPAELVDRGIPLYNFDVAEGVDYEIDLRRPVGDRIVGLSFRGAPLAPDRKLRLALNNYRSNGGGGYTMLQGAPVLWRSSEEVRTLIIEWVERNGAIPAEPTGNWRLRP